jgi:hypothetical protein
MDIQVFHLSKFQKIVSTLRYFHPPPTPPIKGGVPVFLPLDGGGQVGVLKVNKIF